MKTEALIAYLVFVLVGLMISIATLVKLLGVYDFSSDWLWFLTGVGLTIEGIISLVKQKRFDDKYKIIKRKD